MQTFIVVILIAVATLYLGFRWMPKQGKSKLIEWLSKTHPALARLLPAMEKNCSSGCSTCGNCNEGPVTKTLKNQTKSITFIRHL